MLTLFWCLLSSFFVVFCCPLEGRTSPTQLDQYTSQTVLWPIPDGVRLSVPGELGNQQMAELGFVDVTAKPFSADPSGMTDSTEALQKAVNFARDRQMVCYFPAGDYLVSDTIKCFQGFYQRTNGRIVGGRLYPCMLTGPASGKRARILLAPASPGFTNKRTPKYVIHFMARRLEDPEKPRPNISMNQMFTNLDIVIGQGNYGAVAIRHRAAQGSAIQGCRIEVGDGLSGVEGGAGSGGGMAGVTVIGGEIGLDLRESQPGATICAVTLIDQRSHAIIYGGNQSLSAVGIKIVADGRHAAIKSLAGEKPSTGQVSLVDSEIIFKNKAEVAISAARAIYLNNVFVKNAAKIVVNQDKTTLPGSGQDWLHVKEYAHAVTPPAWRKYQYSSPIYVDQVRSENDLVSLEPGAKPPADLQSKHLWQNDFPDWRSAAAINVKAPPYNAKGDGIANDTAALQKAINDHLLIFLPKGYYRITAPLRLRPDTKIIGVARHLSTIMARPQDNLIAESWQGEALVITSADREAQTIINQCGLYVPMNMSGIYALKWQCGPQSILRDVNFISQPVEGYKKAKGSNTMAQQFVLITGNGGGRWYNFYRDSSAEHPDYRHLSIRGSQGPLNIYQCNVEHAKNGPNMEINGSANIAIFGVKGEGNQPIINIKDSADISIFGYGGNAAALAGKALFNVEKSRRITFVNMVDAPKLAGRITSLGRGMDPQLWQMIGVKNKAGDFMTAPLDRPVLFRLN